MLLRLVRVAIAFLLVNVSAVCAAELSTNGDARSISALSHEMEALGPGVRPDEAQRVARCAYASADELRRDYRVLGPPLFHNFLVNTGFRKRGLCFQWAEDLLARLDALKPATLEFHWGEARAGTWREHNCVVVTGKNQPFQSGIVLDCWRHSGHLFWGRLQADHYPWIEDGAYAQHARMRCGGAASRAAIAGNPVPLRMATNAGTRL